MRNLISVALLWIVSISAYADDINFETDKGTITASDIPQDAPKFKDYLIKEIFQGTPAAPKINTGSFKNMRTRIREGAKAGPNFAGHYTLIFVGCGAGAVCLSAIADAKTGNLYSSDLLGSIENFNIVPDIEDHIIEYRKDSSLLRVIGLINENPDLRGISYFVWENNKFKRVRFVPRPN
jgi:hypothetical protein